MDLTPNHNNITTTVKTPEPDTETPTRVKPTPFSNGVLKRHAPPLHHPIVVTYKECLRNHAAALGAHAVDGCGEFMPSLSVSVNPTPTDLKCAACGCHRNFHRREPENITTPPLAIEYQPHHRHHPPPPVDSPNNSPSPPPISSAYYPSAPHMLLALSHSMSAPPADGTVAPSSAGFVPGFSSNPGRKRFRTRFTQEQKEKMSELAERVGWKMLKRDEDVISEFCNGIGVEKGVFKVWMHNNKHNFGKKDQNSPVGYATINVNANANANATTPVIASITGHGYLEEIKPSFHNGQEMSQNLMGNGNNNNGTQVQVQAQGQYQVVGANGSSSSC